ncbi:hypothetical protein IIA79_07825, partial [bacterium]|nr:hypothetical protein [bacterium]
NYKYNNKVYETFSVRSYILHSGRAKVERKFSETLQGEVFSRFDDYNYSIGSTRGNSRASIGSAWQWEPQDDWRFTTRVSSESKSYEVRKDRAYDRMTYEAGARWDPDEQSTVELKGRLTDYDRDFDPGRSYEDSRIELRYRREVNERLDVDVRVLERSKDYDIDPLDDLDQHGVDLGVNFNPSRDWNLYLDVDRDEYDYAYAARSFERVRTGLGGSYSHKDVRVGLDLYRSDQSYSIDPARDFTRDSADLGFDYWHKEHRLSVYLGVGHLDQVDPASVNDYTERRMGASWEFEIDPKTDLTVSFMSSERDYDARDTIEDTRFEAKILFEL